MRKLISIAVICLIFVSMFVSTVNAGSLKSVLVTDVNGFENYTMRNNNTFEPGDEVKVYSQLSNVNHDGFIFCDFVFIIKDPKNNFVAMSQEDIKYRGYDEGAHVLYSYTMPEFWRDGKYKMEIYAYDRTNVSNIRAHEKKLDRTEPGELLDDGDFKDLKNFFETGGNAGSMGAILSYSESKAYKSYASFNVEREVIEEEDSDTEATVPKKELSNFVVNKIDTDKFQVAPNETILISAEVKNIGVSGTRNIEIHINGKKEAETSLTLGSGQTKIIQFRTQKELPGTYKVTIPNQNAVKLFFVKEPTSESSNLVAISPDKEKPKIDFGYIFVFIELILAILIWNHIRTRRGKRGLNLDSDSLPDTDISDITQTQSGQKWFNRLTQDQWNRQYRWNR